MAQIWKLHGDGKNVASTEIVQPEERLSWPRTIGFGAQHVVAMFGATFLVPLITGFPPSTTLLFSGLGTLLFLLITKNRLPSYLGSSFAFLAPIGAAVASGGQRRDVARHRSTARELRSGCRRPLCRSADRQRRFREQRAGHRGRQRTATRQSRARCSVR